MLEPLPARGEENRERILQAAYSLFIRKGFAATSVREIARGAGLTIGGVYAHFAGKEMIWEEVFDRYHPYHEILPLLLDAEGETCAEVFRNAAERIVRELEKREDLFNLMFIELVEFNGKHLEQMALKALPMLSQLGAKFEHCQGRYREITPLNLARAFAGLFFSLVVTDRFLPSFVRGQLNREKAREEFVDIFLFGILADDDPSRRAHG
ncbi:MAG TPA: TetR/AcrR family transcriptional regulator [Anaerolinea thermolimosa]|uniref:TetR/AcrR family transcriptional regulator n=1 Tax=Anaerolinea thermolimosa TaxID=229919 RepID=A0A3D1JF11_9CHLR|nr:TetR/AcrR family transcriptional regulator [Anaerolinea thermolimosa]GAP05656.1 transcriptional regulator, TetR family [Anaerolinea thermolimosa]HCE17180.1 TetR/AcrR family transcriptional regulator [Anaerolinea thermolimosa]